MLLIIVISFIIIGIYVTINIIDRGPNLKDFIYFILIMLGVFLGGMIEDYKQESQNNFKSKIDHTKNSEVLNNIDTLVTYRDSVLLIFK
jgi:hypothetical protein